MNIWSYKNQRELGKYAPFITMALNKVLASFALIYQPRLAGTLTLA